MKSSERWENKNPRKPKRHWHLIRLIKKAGAVDWKVTKDEAQSPDGQNWHKKKVALMARVDFAKKPAESERKEKQQKVHEQFAEKITESAEGRRKEGRAESGRGGGGGGGGRGGGRGRGRGRGNASPKHQANTKEKKRANPTDT